MPPLRASFFARPCLEVAPELLGCLLVRRVAGGVRLCGRIVEVEAYLGEGLDPASHAHRGPTPRNRVMFGPPGRLYVYRSMGIHHCANVVCEPCGRGAAVLLRAVEPLAGVEWMRARRRRLDSHELASGPGKLCEAFEIDRRLDGSSCLRGELRILAAPSPPAERVLCGPRIGIRRAAEHPWRFLLEGNPHVTRSPLNRRARSPVGGYPPAP